MELTRTFLLPEPRLDDHRVLHYIFQIHGHPELTSWPEGGRVETKDVVQSTWLYRGYGETRYQQLPREGSISHPLLSLHPQTTTLTHFIIISTCSYGLPLIQWTVCRVHCLVIVCILKHREKMFTSLHCLKQNRKSAMNIIIQYRHAPQVTTLCRQFNGGNQGRGACP